MLAGIVFVIYHGTQTEQTSQRPLPLNTVTPSPVPTIAIAQQPSPVQIAARATLTPTITPAPQVDDSYLPIENASLFIPALAVSTPIIRVFLDGTSWDITGLGANAGHLQGTNWLHQGGNVVLSGHVELSDGRRGIFANLQDLSDGDRIYLRQNGIEYVYAVTDIYNVEPDDLTPLYPTAHDQLTLITCDGYNFFSDTYRERTVVVAERIV